MLCAGFSLPEDWNSMSEEIAPQLEWIKFKTRLHRIASLRFLPKDVAP